jgi:hypothetical protein
MSGPPFPRRTGWAPRARSGGLVDETENPQRLPDVNAIVQLVLQCRVRPRTGLGLKNITITIDGFSQALGAIEGLTGQAQEFARGGVDDIEL